MSLPIISQFPPLDPASAPISSEDWAILNGVDQAIQQGQDVKKWWADNRQTRVQEKRHPIARQIHRPDRNYGFLMNADLRLGSLPVSGVIQEQIFAFPKGRTTLSAQSKAEQRKQLRTFIMRHFMHLTSQAVPETCGDQHGAKPDTVGWQYEQVFYKLQGTGEIGKFPAARARDLISLDEVGPKYAWVVFKVVIHHLNFTIDLAGTPAGPGLTASLKQPVHTVMTPDFLMDEEDPEPGVLGCYGYGYSVVPDPNYKSVLAAGPSALTNTIETLHFRLLESGEICANMDFIMPQPDKIINFDPEKMGLDIADHLSFGMASKVFAPVSKLLSGITPDLDPMYMAMRFANLATLGLAGDEFSINRETLLKTFMSMHFTDVFNMFNLVGSHFSMVPDWTDAKNLPAWARYAA